MGLKNATLQEAFKDMEHGTYDLTKDGKCTGCGGCCSNILPMTKEEIRIIKEYIKKNNIRPHKQVIAPLTTHTLDLTCPFLDLRKSYDKCMIYEVRPLVCKSFICSDPYNLFNYKEAFQENREAINVKNTFYKT